VRSTAPGADRQVPQAGIELIGADTATADAEVMLVAAEALAALGLHRLSIDLTLPTLVPTLLDHAGFDAATSRLLSRALDRKDAATVTAHAGAMAPMLTDLLLAAGPAAPALQALRRASLPPECRTLSDRLHEVIERVHAAAPDLRLTVDPLEFRGYRYHTGVALTLFAPGRHEELGRGGRYFSAEGEPATGITLYADAALRAAEKPPAPKTIYLPAGTPPARAAALRAEGFVTLAGLSDVADAKLEAHRLGCSHALAENGTAISVP
jgi:ATP phosphoribosyltransferase regulatory subunit